MRIFDPKQTKKLTKTSVNAGRPPIHEPKFENPAYVSLPKFIVNSETKWLSVGHRGEFNKFPQLEIIMLTDLQFGHKEFNDELFAKYRDWILENPARHVVLGGDLIDAATVFSVGSPYENRVDPMHQVFEVVDLLAPLKHRILGYVGGNHERRTSKTFGDAGYIIADKLKIPYSSGKQLIDVYYGDHKPFKITLYHGRGAARTKGARANMVHEIMRQGDSQLYLVGHLSDAIVLFDWRESRTSSGELKLLKICGAMSSSFLKYWGTYAEVGGYSPSDTLMARTILYPQGGWEVTLR
jgi:hypothetical protein